MKNRPIMLEPIINGNNEFRAPIALKDRINEKFNMTEEKDEFALDQICA